MGKQRPERELVIQAYKENPRIKAYEIAEEVGLVESLGYDKAVDYVRGVKKSLKEKGIITVGAYATDEERLTDITTLFEIRQDTINHRTACLMLLLNCYYRLRSEDDDVHMAAFDDTYAKNKSLKDPCSMIEAVKACDIALVHYMNSINIEKNEEARKRGFPGAGLNYTDESFIEKLSITEEELQHMISIKGG